MFIRNQIFLSVVFILVAGFFFLSTPESSYAQSNCCTPGGNGGLGCDNQACQDLICGQDAFCCNTSWDGICAGDAIDQCAVCDGPPPTDPPPTGPPPTFIPPPSASIPTMGGWGLIAMAGVLGIVGFMVIRRRKVTA